MLDHAAGRSSQRTNVPFARASIAGAKAEETFVLPGDGRGAARLARDRLVDLHGAVAPVERGRPPEAAAQILS